MTSDYSKRATGLVINTIKPDSLLANSFNHLSDTTNNNLTPEQKAVREEKLLAQKRHKDKAMNKFRDSLEIKVKRLKSARRINELNEASYKNNPEDDYFE